MKYIKENPVLSMGIFLPILLMLIFFMSAQLPKAMVEPPRHDVFFTLKNYVYGKKNDIHNQYDIIYSVDNNRLKATANLRSEKDRKRNSGYRHHLYVYDVGTQTAIQIKPTITKGKNGDLIVGLGPYNDIEIMTAKTSPDGYSLRKLDRRRSGLFGEIFYSSRSRNTLIISKGSSHHKIDLDRNINHNNKTIDDIFLGWGAAK